MNAVLYTHDLEPITVLDVPVWAWARLRKGEPIRFHVIEPVRFHLRNPQQVEDAVTRMPLRTVEVTGEVLRRRGAETMMLFTRDEESALLLKADFLPGQRREQQTRERGAYAHGLMTALLGGGF